MNTEGRHLLRSSYLGNDKSVVAKDMSDKLWVAGHETLRSYTGIVGNLLDVEALKKRLLFQIVSERLADAQKGYQKAVLAILEDSATALRQNPKLEWKGGLNSRGQPIVDPHNHLMELKEMIVTPHHEVLWKRYEEADAAMGNALFAATYLLQSQPNVPLVWVDGQNVKHHLVLDKKTFPDAAKVCERLYLLGCIEKWGQINAMTVSDSAAEILKNVDQTSDVFSKLDKEFLEKLQHAECASLNQYLHDAFVTMRSVHDLDALRMDPLAQASFNTAYLKDTLDPLHIATYPVNKNNRSSSTSSRGEVCPVTGQRSHEEYPKGPAGKHWCVQILEGCQNIPAQHGYGGYR
jgi:hypothetical protein